MNIFEKLLAILNDPDLGSIEPCKRGMKVRHKRYNKLVVFYRVLNEPFNVPYFSLHWRTPGNMKAYSCPVSHVERFVDRYVEVCKEQQELIDKVAITGYL